ncbi:hypothetical protein KA977_10260, partial [Candidatus Dependentiae bacterium]|nr:hypothetical protein [Candidatus Dependentiae bacterium]
ITDIDDKLNYLVFLILKTDNSVKRIDLPPDIFKTFHLGLSSALGFFLQTIILSFLMIRDNVKLSVALYSFFNAVTVPVKKITEKIKIFDYFHDENPICLIFTFLLYVFTVFIIGFDYNFHRLANIIITGFYNCISIIEIIITVICCSIILNFVKVKYEPLNLLKKILNDLSFIFINPVKKVFKFRIGNYDLTPIICAVLLYIIFYIFSSVMIGIFYAYNVGI